MRRITRPLCAFLLCLGVLGSSAPVCAALDDGVSVPLGLMIRAMNRDMLSVGDDYFSLLTVEGRVQMFWRSYKADQPQSAYDSSAELSSEASSASDHSQEDPPAQDSGESSPDPSAQAQANVDKISLEVGAVENVLAVNCGAHSTVLLKNTGEVIHFDFDGNVLNGDSPYEFMPVKNVEIAATGENHFVVLYHDGTVGSVVSNRSTLDKELSRVSEWSGIVQLAVGENHTVGVTEAGTVVAAGLNSYGQRDVTQFSGAAFVAAEKNHTVVLFEDGTVRAVGENSHGQCNVSDFSNIVSIDTNPTGTVGLQSNGTVVYAGSNQLIEKTLKTWNSIVAVRCGRDFVVAIREDGSLLVAQGDTENPIVTGGEQNINGNEVKSLKDNRIKLNETFQARALNEKTLQNDARTREQNRINRIISASILAGIFVAVVIVYSYVLHKRGKRI